MSQKTAVNHQEASAKKSFKRYAAASADAKSQSRPKTIAPPTSAQSKNGSVARPTLILAAVIVMTAGLVTLFVLLSAKNGSEGTRVPVNETEATEPVAVEPATPDPAAQDAASKEAAKQVLTELKEFQAATQNSMSFEEYDGRLARLNANLNSTLPTFGRQSSDSDSFRQEVAAALREYDAARNWWKTCIRNSTVLSDGDRTERLQADWNQAQTHLDNAEKLYSTLKDQSD